MRAIQLCLMGCLTLGLVACGNKPSGSGPNASGNPKDLILGKWQPAKDNPKDRSIDWSGLGIQGAAGVILKIEKDGYCVLTDVGTGSGLYHKYSFPDEGTIEFKELLLRDPNEKEKDQPRPSKSRKLKVKVTGEDLTLADDNGKVEKYARYQNVPANITIHDLPLHCDKCAAELKKSLDQAGVSDLAIDVAKRTATLKIKDREYQRDVRQAVEKAGMHGFFAVNGKELLTVEPVGTTIDDQGKPTTEIVLKGVHCCCPGCEKTITDLAKNAKVTFEGDGPLKTVKIAGEKMDSNAIILALWKAGFCVTGR